MKKFIKISIIFILFIILFFTLSTVNNKYFSDNTLENNNTINKNVIAYEETTSNSTSLNKIVNENENVNINVKVNVNENKVINKPANNITDSKNNVPTNNLNQNAEVTHNSEPAITEEPVTPEIEYIEGFEVAGYIKIPKFNVHAPVFKKVTIGALELSVSVAYGSLNKEGNTTIFGHAYPNLPFENISKLENGDKIIIIDSNKKEITYEVYDKQIINHNDATYMIRDTEGRKEITMQTGHSDTTRLIVSAKEI